MDEAEFEGVAPDLDQVVEEGAHSRQGVGGAEQGHVPELDEHLEVVIECSLVLRSRTLHLDLAHLTRTRGLPGLRPFLILITVRVSVLVSVCLLVILQPITDASVGILTGGTQSSEQVKAHFSKLQLLLGVRYQRLLGLTNLLAVTYKEKMYTLTFPTT